MTKKNIRRRKGQKQNRRTMRGRNIKSGRNTRRGGNINKGKGTNSRRNKTRKQGKYSKVRRTMKGGRKIQKGGTFLGVPRRVKGEGRVGGPVHRDKGQRREKKRPIFEEHKNLLRQESTQSETRQLFERLNTECTCYACRVARDERIFMQTVSEVTRNGKVFERVRNRQIDPMASSTRHIATDALLGQYSADMEKQIMRANHYAALKHQTYPLDTNFEPVKMLYLCTQPDLLDGRRLNGKFLDTEGNVKDKTLREPARLLGFNGDNNWSDYIISLFHKCGAATMCPYCKRKYRRPTSEHHSGKTLFEELLGFLNTKRIVEGVIPMCGSCNTSRNEANEASVKFEKGKFKILNWNRAPTPPDSKAYYDDFEDNNNRHRFILAMVTAARVKVFNHVLADFFPTMEVKKNIIKIIHLLRLSNIINQQDTKAIVEFRGDDIDFQTLKYGLSKELYRLYIETSLEQRPYFHSTGIHGLITEFRNASHELSRENLQTLVIKLEGPGGLPQIAPPLVQALAELRAERERNTENLKGLLEDVFKTGRSDVIEAPPCMQANTAACSHQLYWGIKVEEGTSKKILEISTDPNKGYNPVAVEDIDNVQKTLEMLGQVQRRYTERAAGFLDDSQGGGVALN